MSRVDVFTVAVIFSSRVSFDSVSRVVGVVSCVPRSACLTVEALLSRVICMLTASAGGEDSNG